MIRLTTTLVVTSAFCALVLLLSALLVHSLRALRKRELRYRTLVDALPEAVLVHRGGKLLLGNAAARTLVGAKSGELLSGVSMTSLALEPDRKLILERTRRVLGQGVRSERRETRIRRLDGAVIWVEVQGARVEYGGAPAVLTVMRDITARKQREESDAARIERMQRQSDMLRRVATHHTTASRSGLRPALEGICADTAQVLGADRVTIWALEDEGATLACTAYYERASGVWGGDLPRLSTNRLPLFLAALREERVMDRPTVAADVGLRELVEAASPVCQPSMSLVAAAIRRSGEVTGVVTIGQLDARIWQMDETGFAGAVADHVAQVLLGAEREQVLADLQVLAAELMRIQNEERRRIGRELHDSTGQTLAALEMDLARLSEATRSLAQKPRELLENAVRLARQCSSEIRTASYLLHPPLLDELGLLSALRWLAPGLRERCGLEVRLDLPDSMPRLSRANELTLFRVAQEALTNVQRHSASPWVALRLEVLPHAVSLEVRDAGPCMAGRDQGVAAVPRVGVGLAGMRERIRQVGGTFSMDFTTTGTRICATVPLQVSSEARSA